MSNSWDEEEYYRDRQTEESEIAREEWEIARADPADSAFNAEWHDMIKEKYRNKITGE